MNRKVLTLLLVFAGFFPSYALKWHDTLIAMILAEPIRDKQIVVERDENTLEIKRASYRFSFAKDYLAEKVKSILYSHLAEAVKFSSEKGETLMQVIEKPNTVYTYRIGLDPSMEGRHLILISVKKEDGKSAKTELKTKTKTNNMVKKSSNIKQGESAGAIITVSNN